MIGASQVAPLVKKLTRDRERVEFGDLVRQVYQKPYADLKPIQRMIVESELVDLGWRKRGGESVWAPER
jgi:hypothetical protein